PTRTNVVGLDICDLMPRLARMADKYTIVRSLHHERAEHSGGTHRFLSGHASIAANLQNGEFPELGSVVARKLEHHGSVPVFVPDPKFYGAGPAYLGRSYAPFMVAPNNPLSASGANRYDPIPIFGNRDGVQLAADSTLRLQQRADLLDHLD